MISLAPTRARIAALLATALATTTVAASAPSARAEATDPVLTSVTLASPTMVTPGDPLRVAYSATDDSPTLRGMSIVYWGSSARKHTATLGSDLALSGEAVATVPQGLPNELLRAGEVRLIDQAGHTIRFERGGDVCRDFNCGDDRHTLDLSVLDIQVSGSTPDNAVPVVTSVTAGTPTVPVKGSARVVLGLNELNPDSAQPWPEGAVLQHYSGHKLYLTDWDGNGTLSGTVPDTAPNGTYVLQTLWVRDAPGNTAYYHSQGWIANLGFGSTGPTRHTLDFASTTVTVTGQTVDRAVPLLTSISYPRGLLQYGAINQIAFTGIDDLSGIHTIDLEYSSPTLSPRHFQLSTTVTGANTAAGLMPVVTSGEWQLDRITVRDKWGNQSTESPGGAIDFSALQATVLGVPDGPSASVTTKSGAAALRWNAPVHDGGSPVTGYKVTVSPSGKNYYLGASARSLTVTGLTNNTRYTFAVRARNSVGLSGTQSLGATPRALQRLFMTPDVSNDGKPDIVAVTRSNTAYIYRGTGAGGISGSGFRAATGLAEVRALLPIGTSAQNALSNVLTVYFFGRADLWAAYNGNRLTPDSAISLPNFYNYRHVVTAGNFIGTSRPDVLAVNDAGDLYLWAGRPDSERQFYSPKKIGTGWQYFTTVIGVGDLDGDRRNDLVARKKDGTLWLYAGNGTGGFRYKKQIGTSTSWKSFAQIAGMGDFTGDKRNDLLALAPNGYLYVYKGNGKGGFTGKALISKGFSSFV